MFKDHQDIHTEPELIEHPLIVKKRNDSILVRNHPLKSWQKSILAVRAHFRYGMGHHFKSC